MGCVGASSRQTLVSLLALLAAWTDNSSPATSNWIHSYGYTFSQSGWHMLVVNQTWMKPTIVSEVLTFIPLFLFLLTG